MSDSHESDRHEIYMGSMTPGQLRELVSPALEIKDAVETYKMLSLAPDGKLEVMQTTELPPLAGRIYKGKATGKYGDPRHCQTATPHHKKSYEESGEFPDLVFFANTETAVALNFTPCNNCWVNPRQEKAVERWREYERACTKFRITPVQPGARLLEALRQADRKNTRTALDRAKEGIMVQITQMLDIDPQDTISIDNKAIDATLMVSGFIPERAEQVGVLMSRIAEMVKDGTGEQLLDPDFFESFLYENLQTSQEILVNSVHALAERLQLSNKHLLVLLKSLQSDLPILGKERQIVLLSVSKLAERIDSSDVPSVGLLADITASLYARMHNGSRKELRDITYATILHASRRHRLEVAGIWVAWLESSMNADQMGVVEAGEEVDVMQISRMTRFLDTLFPLLSQDDVNEVGRMLTAVDKGSKEGLSISELLASQPVFRGIVSCFSEANLVRFSAEGTVKLKPKAGPEQLTYDYLDQVVRVIRHKDEMLQAFDANQLPLETLDDLIAVYDINDQEKAIEHLVLNVGDDHPRLLPFTGLDLGHQDASPRYFKRIAELISTLPADVKPSAIIINQLMWGVMENRKKNLRAALATGLTTLERQFKAGKIVIDELRKRDIPVVLNLSAADWEIGRDILLRILRSQYEFVGHIPYYRQDQLQMTDDWDKYDKAIVDVGLPYCIRKGHVLSADNLLLLFEVHKELVQAQNEGRKPILSERVRSIIDIDAVPLPGKTDYGDGLFIVDDVILTAYHEASGFSTTQVYYDKYNFSTSNNPPRYGNPLQSLAEAVRQEATMAGQELENTAVSTLMDQGQFLAFQVEDEKWVMSTPAAKNSSTRTTRGSRKRAVDPSRRDATSRREAYMPGSFMFEQLPDGRVRFWPLFGPLLDLMNVSSERHAVLPTGDLQLGSVTHLPHLAVLANDMDVEEAEGGPVDIIEQGDFGQFENYSGKHHNEKAEPNLVDAEDQEKFGAYIRSLTWERAREAAVRHIAKVRILSGNHERNKSFQHYGNTFTNNLETTYLELMAHKNVPQDERDVQVSQNMVTQTGGFFRSFAAVEEMGGYPWLFVHMALEKGGKGSVPVPVYELAQLFKGSPTLLSDIVGGTISHWHFGQIFSAFGKVFTVDPPLAEQSEYEFTRAHRSIPGKLIMRFGGGLPPAFEFIPRRTILSHVIKDGIFCEESLNDMGFFTDPEYDPLKHGYTLYVRPFDINMLRNGYVPEFSPRSALMKYLWHLEQSIPRQAHALLTNFGPLPHAQDDLEAAAR